MSTFLDDLLERYRVVLDENDDVRSMFQGLVEASLRAVQAHPYGTAVYQHDAHYFRETPRLHYVRLAAERVRQTWIGVLEAGITEGVFRSDIPARYLYLLLRDGLWLTVRWFHPSSTYGVDEFAADCCRLYYQALASEESLRTMLARGADASSSRPDGLPPRSR